MSDFDFTDFGGSGRGQGKNDEQDFKQPIPNGTYVAKIRDCAMDEYKGKKRISITFEVAGGTYDRRRVFYHVNSQSTPDGELRFDKKGLGKVIYYGQGFDGSNTELLVAKGRRIKFNNYGDMIQYLNSGIYMKITTVIQYSQIDGHPYSNPEISKFEPAEPSERNQNTLVEETKAPQSVSGKKETSDEDDFENLPF